jgi:hypothetical protein
VSIASSRAQRGPVATRASAIAILSDFRVIVRQMVFSEFTAVLVHMITCVLGPLLLLGLLGLFP